MRIKIPKVKLYGIDVVKNAIFFGIFFVISVIFLILFISPSVKEFKYYKSLYINSKLELEQKKLQFKLKKEEIDKLIKNNSLLLNKLKNKFKQTDFIHYSYKFITIISIKKQKTTLFKKDFIKTEYKITAFIENLNKFYDYIKYLKNYKNIIQIDYPISFQGKKDKIEVSFHINVINLPPR